MILHFSILQITINYCHCWHAVVAVVICRCCCCCRCYFCYFYYCYCYKNVFDESRVAPSIWRSFPHCGLMSIWILNCVGKTFDILNWRMNFSDFTLLIFVPLVDTPQSLPGFYTEPDALFRFSPDTKLKNNKPWEKSSNFSVGI